MNIAASFSPPITMDPAAYATPAKQAHLQQADTFTRFSAAVPVQKNVQFGIGKKLLYTMAIPLLILPLSCTNSGKTKLTANNSKEYRYEEFKKALTDSLESRGFKPDGWNGHKDVRHVTNLTIGNKQDPRKVNTKKPWIIGVNKSGSPVVNVDNGKGSNKHNFVMRWTNKAKAKKPVKQGKSSK